MSCFSQWKKGKPLSACSDMIWSKLFPQKCNFEYHWNWMSLTSQSPIISQFLVLTSAHCSSPFLESTILRSDGLIKNLSVLKSTSYIFIRGSVSIFLLCRLMFFSGLLLLGAEDICHCQCESLQCKYFTSDCCCHFNVKKNHAGL